MASSPLPLKISIATYGHTKAIKDGSVQIEGVKPEFIEVNPQIAAFRRMVRSLEFDVCEVAPVTYMIAREHGIKMKALPIFVSRGFHHSGFVYRPDAGINKPKDLEGKNAGVRAFSVTTGVWGRGILQNEYDIDTTNMTWWVDDEEHVTTLKLPDFVKHVPEGKSLVSMMEAGEIQAGFTGNAGLGRTGAPKEGWAAAPKPKEQNYTEFFKDSKKAEEEWFKRTGIYPFHGTIAIRDEVIDQHPWVAKSLFKAFTESKERWLKALNRDNPADAKDKKLADYSKFVGDPLPYGIEPNRASIEALIKYSHQQGLLKRSYDVNEMFVDPEKL